MINVLRFSTWLVPVTIRRAEKILSTGHGEITMKKIWSLLLASLLTVSTANLALAEDVIDPAFLSTGRSYRVIWNYDSQAAIDTMEADVVSLSQALIDAEVEVFTGYGGDAVGDTAATSGSRSGVTASGFSQLISSNVAEEGERATVIFQMTWDGEYLGEELFAIFMEATNSVTIEDEFCSLGIIEGAQTGNASLLADDSIELLAEVAHGDGFFTTAVQLITSPGSAIFECENILIGLEGVAEGKIIDQIIIDVAYFEGDNVPNIKNPPVVVDAGDGVVVSEASPLVTDSFTVQMNTDPNFNLGSLNGSVATVTLTPDPNTSDDFKMNSGAFGDSISFTFDSSTWHIPEVVTVTVNDDVEIEPNVNCIELFGINFSVSLSDPNANVELNGSTQFESDLISVIDDEVGCVFVDTGDGVEINELDPNGSIDTVTYVLNRPPSGSDNVITLTDENTLSELIPDTLTFNSGNWSVPQTVSIKAIQDDEFLEEVNPFISGQSSGDIDPNAFNPVPDVEVSLIEDECGEFPFITNDLNFDCYVNLLDFSLFAGSWADCTEPDITNCP